MAPKWARLAPDLYNLGPFWLNLRATLTCQLAAIDTLLDGSALQTFGGTYNLRCVVMREEIKITTCFKGET